jgi:hypothetical protein
MGGNIKDDHEDEVAEWEYEEEASSYTTFTVPYGKGILLNASRSFATLATCCSTPSGIRRKTTTARSTSIGTPPSSVE